MKRLLALMLCFFLLTACTRQEVPVNTTMPSASTASTTVAAPELTGLTGENADNNYLVYNNFECMSESDSVIYKLVNARTSIYYYDKASGISGPLCGNPDCNHTTQDCEAFIGSAMALQYYNGNLYFIAGDLNSSSGMWLWKADVNGKNREKLKQIDVPNIIMIYQPQCYFIHRDRLFLLCLTYDIKNGVPMSHTAVLSSPLDGSEEFTILWEEKSESVLEYTYQFSDQYVYIALVTDGDAVNIFRLNFLDGTMESLFSEENNAYIYGGIHLTEQNELYLSGSDATAVYAWKIENGEKTDTVIIESDSNFPPKILDGLVIDTRPNADNQRIATVKTLSGETIYDGLLFPNGIPEIESELDLNTCNYGEVGGTGSLIAFYMGADGNGSKPAEYIVYLDTAQNMKPIYIFPC